MKPSHLALALLLIPLGSSAEPGAPDFADVRYGLHERDVFDLWLAKSEEPTPVVVFAHGGGFVGGDKSRASRRDLAAFRQAGVTYVSINYPFKTQVPWPDVFRHAARSIQHLRHHADEYTIDPTRIAVYGGSAGGGIASWLAFHDDLKNPDAEDPVLRESSKPLCAAILSSQSTYDQLKWPEILEMDKAVVEPIRGPRHLAEALFLEESELHSEKGIRMRQEIDLLSMIDSSDPPVFLLNRRENVVPGE